MVSSTQLLVSAICWLNIAQAIASSAFLQYLLCVDKANLNHLLSCLSSNTEIMTTGSTIRLMVKTLTKYMQSDFVEEMSSQMFAIVASTTPQIFLHSFVPTRRKQ
jgi:hypothetical protein